MSASLAFLIITYIYHLPTASYLGSTLDITLLGLNKTFELGAFGETNGE